MAKTKRKRVANFPDRGQGLGYESMAEALDRLSLFPPDEKELAKRTIIPGTFVSERGETLTIQKFNDRFIELREKKINDPKGYPDLSPAKARRWFDSETDNEGGRTQESYEFAREVGDWNWKDDGKYIIYDRRYNKNRNIT